MLRTFSKAYGLAGLRVGYAVGHPELITALDKAYVPFTVTSISQAAAIASLDAADELLGRTDAVVAERVKVLSALRGAGYTVAPSQANFVWLPLPEHTADFVRARPTPASSFARTARTASGSPSPRRTKTTHSWISPDAG